MALGAYNAAHFYTSELSLKLFLGLSNVSSVFTVKRDSKQNGICGPSGCKGEEG